MASSEGKLGQLDLEDYNETEIGIFEMLDEGRCTPAYLAEELDREQEYIRARLGELHRWGDIVKIHRGLYGLPKDSQ